MWFIPTVINRMLVRGDAQDVHAAFDYIKGFPDENYLFDLNSIIPMPDCVKFTDEIEKPEDVIEQYGELELAIYRERCAMAKQRCLFETGYQGWYDWSVEHWDSICNLHVIEQDETRFNVLYFCSGQAAPHKPLQVLSRVFPEVVITLDSYNTYASTGSVWHALFVEGDACVEYHPIDTGFGADIWAGLEDYYDRCFKDCDSKIDDDFEWPSIIYVD